MDKSKKWNLMIAALVLYLLPFYYAKLFAWPCAEDYGWPVTIYGRLSLTQAFADAWHHYLNWGGRYLCYASGQLQPLLMFHHAAYVGCCIFAGIIAFIPILGIMLELGRSKSFRENLFWALLFFAAAYSTLAGLEETFYWVANIFSATFGLIALLYGIWCSCYLWNRDKFSYPAFSGAMLAAFVAPGFYEHAAIGQFYIAVTLLLCAWWLRRHRTAFTALAVWEISWVAFMFLAPGNLQRQGLLEAKNSMLESVFMSSRALAGVGLRTIFSPWLLVFPAFIALYGYSANALFYRLRPGKRMMLSLLALSAPVTIAVLHVLARCPIVFSGRTGDSILIISWIGFAWIGVLYSGKLSPRIKRLRFAQYLPVIAVLALFVTVNTFCLWQNILNGSLKTYDRAMRDRHYAFEHGRGKDITVSPLTVAAWPARKIGLGDIGYIGNSGFNLCISDSFGLRSVRLLPSLQEIREFMRCHPEKLSTIESVPPVSGVDGVKMVLIRDVPAGNVKEECLEVQMIGTEQGLGALRELRLIVMTDKCFRPILDYFALKQTFRRLSPVMVAAVYGSRQNHINVDLKSPYAPIERVKMDNGRWKWSLPVSINGGINGHAELIFYSLDAQTYFSGYHNNKTNAK